VGPFCVRLNVTVPVAELPPTTLVGLTDTPASSGAGGGTSTLSTRLNEYRPSDAVIVTSVSAAGGEVAIDASKPNRLVVVGATTVIGATIEG